MKVFSRRVLESAVAWNFLNTGMRIGANVVLLPVLLHKLPPEHLGLWYTFAALASFATLLDLGFESTITRMISYVWAGASRVQAFGITAESDGSRPPNRELLGRLLATLRSYYRVLGLFVLLLLTFGGGAWIWVKTAPLPDAEMLRWAWIAYALGACLNFVGGRWPGLLFGIGAIRQGQQVGVLGLLAYYAVAFAGLLAGYGLWALVAGMLTMGFVMRAAGRRLFIRHAALPQGIPPATFHRDIFAAIWPNAWRTGLVVFGSFLINQANTLICSAFLDLRVTASYGLSFQLTMLLAGLSGVWVQVKVPRIHQLRLLGQTDAIATVFAHRIRLAILCYLAGAGVILYFGPLVLQALGSRTSLLPRELLGTLLLIQFLEMHHSLHAQLVLTENRNPFLVPALVSGLAIVLASWLLTPHLGLWGLLLSAGVVQACFNNWWPVVRSLSGLDQSAALYWRTLFSLPTAWKLS